MIRSVHAGQRVMPPELTIELATRVAASELSD